MAPQILRTDDMAAAQALASSIFGPTLVVPRCRLRHSLASIDLVRIGQVSIAQIDYGDPVEVVARGSRPRVVLQTVMSGSLRCAGQSATPYPLGSTLLYVPNAEFGISLGERCRRLCVVIDGPAMEGLLPTTAFGDGSATVPLGMDTPAGMRWRALVDYLALELQLRKRSQPDIASHDRMLEQWIVTLAGLVCNAGSCDGIGHLPPPVRRAMEFIQARSRERLVLPLIASHAGTSIRTLQLAFVRHLGQTPMEHLRSVRLAKARASLLGTVQGPGAVTRTALEEGFTHLGEFAAAYRRVYGETPSSTLKRS